MNLYAVIMAGGSGTRFWPRSRKATPKQLLNIVSDRTMIQETVDRLEGLIDGNNIFVITNSVQAPEIKKQLSNVPDKNIIAEPMARNTAPCVGLSAVLVDVIDPEAIIVTLPADHLIKDKNSFHKNLKIAAEYAHSSKGLVTIGLPPTRPDTGYGYIKIDNTEVANNVFKVLEFKEKPNLETAETYVASGEYLWNSGMFIWRADTILEEFQKYMPEMHAGLMTLKDSINTDAFESTLEAEYGKMDGISIDYAIMEKSEKVFLTKGIFDWNDVGSWETVYELHEKDSDGVAVVSDAFIKDSKNSYIYAPDKFVSLIGLENVVVVDTGDALLVCHRDKVQDVKETVSYLKENNKNELL